MRHVRVLSNHGRALLAHQCTFGEKIARFNISQFYMIKNNHWVQMIFDIDEFIPEDLFFVIQPLSQCLNTTVSMIKTSLATTNAQPAIIWWRNWYQVWGHGCDTTDSQMSPQPRRSRGCGDIWESVVSQPWPKTRYQFLFYHGTTKLTLNSSQIASQLSKFKGQSHCKHWVTWPDCFATPINT